MEHKLIVELVETKNGNFNKVTCSEKHYITSYKDGDDILSFSASTIVCCPLSVDIATVYRCITEEEYKSLSAQRDLAEEVRRKEELEKIEKERV